MSLTGHTIPVAGSMITNYNDKRVAIVCSHIGKGKLPILRAIRTEPLEPEDSGWQFLCNSGKEEKEDQAQVWLVEEVLGAEPSLSSFINSPVGTAICRKDRQSKWQQQK